MSEVTPTPNRTAALVRDRKGLRIVEERTDSLSPVSERLTLLTVHAHPDDEASKGAPTMAMYRPQGVHTVLVCCTGGEEGDLQNPAAARRRPAVPRPDTRAGEASSPSCGPTNLQRRPRSSASTGRDARLPGLGHARHRANNHPESFHRPLDEATGGWCRSFGERPQVVITYGDDQSGYPHPDHLKVHDISVPAFERAGDPAWYPEAGEPYQPSKLYYAVWSKARLIAIHEGHDQAPRRIAVRRGVARPAGRRPAHHDQLDCREFLWARTGALRAHATKSTRRNGWFGLTDEQLAESTPFEDWILARSLVGRCPRPTVEPICSPVCVRGVAAGVDRERPVPGSRQEGRGVDGPDNADVVITAAPMRAGWPRPDGRVHAGPG